LRDSARGRRPALFLPEERKEVYHHVSGTLKQLSPGEAVVEASGVGYRIAVPLSTSERLPSPGSTCTLLTSLVVRDNSMTLYGFLTEAERRCFERLLGVNRVGPSVAMSVLSGASVADIADAITSGNHALLGHARGVGPKTAERIVRELRSFGPDLQVIVGREAGREVAALPDEAIAGLMTLGFSRSEAERYIRQARQAVGSDASPGELIAYACRKL